MFSTLINFKDSKISLFSEASNPLVLKPKIYVYLQQTGVDPPEAPLEQDRGGLEQAWFMALKAEDTEKMKEVLERGIDPNVKDEVSSAHSDHCRIVMESGFYDFYTILFRKEFGGRLLRRVTVVGSHYTEVMVYIHEIPICSL